MFQPQLELPQLRPYLSFRASLDQNLHADGTMNLVGGLRKAMAFTGYTDIKSFQRIDVMVH